MWKSTIYDNLIILTLLIINLIKFTYPLEKVQMNYWILSLKKIKFDNGLSSNNGSFVLIKDLIFKILKEINDLDGSFEMPPITEKKIKEIYQNFEENSSNDAALKKLKNQYYNEMKPRNIKKKTKRLKESGSKSDMKVIELGEGNLNYLIKLSKDQIDCLSKSTAEIFDIEENQNFIIGN